MITSIHQSMLNMAFRCGEQFLRRYLEGEVIPPGIAMARGTGVHKANEINLLQKIISSTDMRLSDMEDVTRDAYIHSFDNGIYLPKEMVFFKNRLINEGLTDAISLTQLYHSEVAPEIEPIETERKFKVWLPGIPLPLAGQIDIQQHGRLDDLKTSGKKWPDGQIEREIQPIMYSLATEQETGERPDFYYHILRLLKAGPQRQIQKIRATEAHYRALIAKIKTFIKMLDAGVFPPANPSSWWCDSVYCGFWDTCPYVKG